MRGCGAHLIALPAPARGREMARRLLATALAVGLFLAAVTPVAARDTRHDIEHRPNAYVVTNLVSDGSIDAAHTDRNLVNGWGIAAGPTTPWWVSNNGTATSTRPLWKSVA